MNVDLQIAILSGGTPQRFRTNGRRHELPAYLRLWTLDDSKRPFVFVRIQFDIDSFTFVSLFFKYLFTVIQRDSKRSRVLADKKLTKGNVRSWCKGTYQTNYISLMDMCISTTWKCSSSSVTVTSSDSNGEYPQGVYYGRTCWCFVN
ncbi:unnamed protein product [Allacma fusca]|uniref:Uncharacterized protein n=1 Tax=Allacma fusca TaxID=39272 RepID=A0A8J2NRX6_9HEXA|nr:unnamed protein product [Allacma fusca]